MMSQLVKVARAAMGSLFEIYVGGAEAEALERLAHDALNRVDWLEQHLSHFLPDSDICQINARAYQEAVPVAPNLFALLWRLRRLSEETEGAFDCTAGKLVRAWGFFRRGLAQGERVSPPDAEEVVTLARQSGWRNVVLDEEAQTIRFLNPVVELHLGAVGKGYAVQCAADFLREQGVPYALLHSGQSSIAALSAPPESAGWPIGLPDPDREGERLAIVNLRNSALSTSGIAEQFVEIEARRIGHLFDPRTGQPVSGYRSVSVLSPDAAEGDALSTAFFVQGVEWTRAYCRKHPSIEAFFVAEGSDSPLIHVGQPQHPTPDAGRPTTGG
jgi:thiamine biosynthesis lipoprotein